jgi:glutamyl-tRNA reductase
MAPLQQTDISNFFVAGINYKKTDATLRGRFAISNEQYAKLLTLAPLYNVHELFVISTCNRTEIYGFTENVADLCKLLCTQTQGSVEIFNDIAYIKNDKEAIRHLFDVAAGLDSQILGDYEIVGQLKQAVKFSRQHNFIGVYLDRLVNAVLQSSKLIKTNTGLSGGTVSVSFAAIQFIKEKFTSIAGKKILLIGTGKIGRNTCKNLVDYLQTKNITLINRTESKAEELANELGLQFAPLEDLARQVEEADIILVATNADEPVILQSHLLNKGNKIIIDLSIPCNVEKKAQDLNHITLVNVDDLSKIKDATLHKREAEIPKAEDIIKEQIFEFLEWHEMRKNVPLLKAVKNKLYAMHNCELYISYFAKQNTPPVTPTITDLKIQKVINGMAVNMRNQNQRGCNYITAINEFIATGTN